MRCIYENVSADSYIPNHAVAVGSSRRNNRLKKTIQIAANAVADLADVRLFTVIVHSPDLISSMSSV